MSEHRFTLSELKTLLSEHRKTMAISFAVLIVATLLIAMLLPRTYVSEAQLLVRLGRENVRVDPMTTLSDGQARVMSMDSRQQEINTVAAILTNRNLLAKVVDTVGVGKILETDDGSTGGSATKQLSVVANVEAPEGQIPPLSTLTPKDKAIRILKDNLDVEAIRNTNLVSITFRSHAPQTAQEVISRLVEMYLDEHMRLYRTPGAHEFLSHQTAVMREKLTEAERELRDRKRETGLIAVDDQRKAIVGRIANLEDQLSLTRASIAETDAQVQQLRTLLDGLAKTEVTSELTGNDNYATDGMRQQLYTLQLKEKEMSAIYTDNHVKVRQIREQIAAAQKVLDAEDARKIEKTRGLSRAYEETQLQLLDKEPLLSALRAKGEALEEQLSLAKESLNKFNEDEVILADLERNVAIHDQNYRIYATDTEQARIDHALSSARMTNISVVQPATLNVKPTFPNFTIIFFLGFAVAVSGSIGSAFVLDHLHRSEQSLHRSEQSAH